MKERYLGDSHDVLKYTLLSHLSGELGLRLGVDWYASPAYVEVGCCGETSGLTKVEDRDRGEGKDRGSALLHRSGTI